MSKVTFKGAPVALEGNEVKAGQTAPDFRTQKSDMNDYSLASSSGKTRILLSVPSLDTPVCDAETKRFNEEASKVPGVEIACISMDLPFAMNRWCGAAGGDKSVTGSDHRQASVGQEHGGVVQSGPFGSARAPAGFVDWPGAKGREFA